MKNSTIKNQHTNDDKPAGLCRALVLVTALMALLPSAKAAEWGFTLKGPTTTENVEPSNPPEVLRLTGAGKFNPDAQTASGGGAFYVVNATDEIDELLGGPIFRGTWRITKFLGFTPNGGLAVEAALTFKVGLNEANEDHGPYDGIPMIISEDGISLSFYGLELFGANFSGSVAFHQKKP